MEDILGQLLASLPKLRSLEQKPPKWHWPSMIGEGCLTLIAGEPGAMKSMLLQSFACGISQGKLWTTECDPQPVIYLDRENPLAVVQQRTETFELDNEDNLWYWGLWNETPPPPIGHEVYPYIASKLKPIFIFDSMVRFHKGDENDATQVAASMEHFRQLCALGASVVLLHHKGKPKSEGPTSPYRGTSEIAGACDIGFSLIKKKSEMGFSLILEGFKNRFEEEKAIKFNFNEHGIITPIELPITIKDTGMFAIQEQLAKFPMISQNHIRLLTKIGEARLRSLLKQGLGTMWNEHLDGTAKKYALVDYKGLSGIS